MPPRLRFTLLPALVIPGLLALAAWWWLGRPVALLEPPVAGPLRCLSYAPFRAGQSPFDEGAGARLDPALLEEDLLLLSRHTTCVRLYASGGMEAIPAIARRLGMQVLLGAWVSSDAAATRREIEALVRLADQYPETVRAVLVGNEALLRREIAPEALAALLREVKGRVAQPVSYADVWEFQLRHPQVAEAGDFVTIHILPYWEDQPVAIDQAVDHVRAIRRQVAARFQGRAILIGETGWPGVGRMREGALPGAVNEARFIRGFVAAARAEGWDYNLIEAFDQPWKRRLEGAVGGYWGLFDAARRDKQLLHGEVRNHPHWLGLGLLAAALAALLAAAARLPATRAPLAAGVALGWTLQLEQLWRIVRDPLEAAAALFLSGALLMASFAPLARLARRPLAPRLEAHAALLAGALGAILSLWLLFDPRYRDFFFAGFLPPALLHLLLLRQRLPVVRAGDEERAVGLLLVVSAVLIVAGEKLINGQALAWGAATAILGAALLARGRRARG